MRRIEAITGPASAELFRERTERLHELAAPAARAGGQRGGGGRAAQQAGQGARARRRRGAGPRRGRRAGGRRRRRSPASPWWSRPVERARREDAAARSPTPSGSGSATRSWCSAPPSTGACTWWQTSRPAAVERGVKAGDVVRAAAEVAGGGGGGRDTMAQAGGRDPEKLPEALATARAAIERALRADAPHPRSRPWVGPLRLRGLRSVRHARHAAAGGRAARHEEGPRRGGEPGRGSGRRARDRGPAADARRARTASRREAARAFAERLDAETQRPGGVARRAPHDAARRAHRRGGGRGLPRGRPPARELPRRACRRAHASDATDRRRCRAAARPRSARPRAASAQARRAGARGGPAPPPAAPPAADDRDWLAEAERLTTEAARAAADGDGPPPGQPPRAAARAGAAWSRSPRCCSSWPGVALVPRSRSSSRSRATARGKVARRRSRRAPASARSPTCSRARASCRARPSSSCARRLAGRSDALKPGRYTLARDMSFSAALDALEQGLPPERGPGRDPGGPVARGDRAARSQGAARQLHQRQPAATRRSTRASTRRKGAKSLEGFLFPATYELKRGQPRAAGWSSEQLTAFKRNFADGGHALRAQQEPHALRRADHRLAGRARGAGAEGAPADRLGDLQPAARGDPRSDIDATTRFVVGQLVRSRCTSLRAAEPDARTTRACTRACRRGRSATPASPRSRRPPPAPRRTTSSTWRPCAAAASTSSPPRTPSSSATWTQYNRARDKRGGKSPTEC